MNAKRPYWDGNLRALQTRFPQLADRVQRSGLGAQICSLTARDGLPAYGLRRGERVQMVTNPADPLTQINAQLEAWTTHLQDVTRPILLVGVHPGLEVLHLFNLCEELPGVHCEQPLWICIDSFPAFCGFLKTYDARALVLSARVELFLGDELPARVAWLRAHPEFPYLFTMISMSPPAVQQSVLAPLVQLIQERSDLVKRYQAENEAFYAALSDAHLAQIIAGRAHRRPRVMVPSCSWSTVIQYSIRDAVGAFERAGWEAHVLDSPAMLTPFYAMEAIRRVRPDLFLYVNHLRQEVAGVVPEHLMLVSWIQDTLVRVNRREVARRWNEQTAGRHRDLIVGYTRQLKPYGYSERRLRSLPMVVDAEVFKPRALTDFQQERYGCDLCFASNCSLPTNQLVREVLSSAFAVYGWDSALLMRFHDQLWAHYRAGDTVTSYAELIRVLQLDASASDESVQQLFWRLNDPIYRHVVLEWLDDYARAHPNFKLHLYGTGWENHPRFAVYARGTISHGAELSAAYQTARFALHLNSFEGDHQRAREILSSSGRCLMRRTPARRGAPRTRALRALEQTIQPLSAYETHLRADILCYLFEVGRVWGDLQDAAPDSQFWVRIASIVQNDLEQQAGHLREEQLIAFGTRKELLRALQSKSQPKRGALPSSASVCSSITRALLIELGAPQDRSGGEWFSALGPEARTAVWAGALVATRKGPISPDQLHQLDAVSWAQFPASVRLLSAQSFFARGDAARARRALDEPAPLTNLDCEQISSLLDDAATCGALDAVYPWIDRALLQPGVRPSYRLKSRLLWWRGRHRESIELLPPIEQLPQWIRLRNLWQFDESLQGLSQLIPQLDGEDRCRARFQQQLTRVFCGQSVLPSEVEATIDSYSRCLDWSDIHLFLRELGLRDLARKRVDWAVARCSSPMAALQAVITQRAAGEGATASEWLSVLQNAHPEIDLKPTGSIWFSEAQATAVADWALPESSARHSLSRVLFILRLVDPRADLSPLLKSRDGS